MPERVLKRGRPVGEIAPVAVPAWARGTVHVAPIGLDDLRIPWQGGMARVIGLVPDQIITTSLLDQPAVSEGFAVADPSRDLAKVAVFERHRETGRVGLGFVHGFGLERGAFGSTVAHDGHNLIVVGVDDEAMLRAAERLRELGGGIVVTGEGVEAELPLPVAGLLSDRPLAEVLAASREVGRRTQSARGHPPPARANAGVPVALGDPVAEDHRPWSDRRRPVRNRPARGLTTVRRNAPSAHGYDVRRAVAVAQLVEPRVVVPVVAGSSPVRHPLARLIGKAP